MNDKEIPINSPDENDSAEREGVGRNEQHTTGGNDKVRDELAARIVELERENQQLMDQKLRAVAELDNVRRRSQQELANVIRHANSDMLRELLPIVDDFERSIESGEKTKDFQSLYDGILLIRNNLLKILERSEVKKISSVGEEFDVELHEAMMRQPSEAPEGTVIGELEPGYMYRDKVLRHAKVIVSAGE